MPRQCRPSTCPFWIDKLTPIQIATFDLEEYRRVRREFTTDEWIDLLCKTEGIIPAIESAHALAGALELAKELGPDSTILVNLSGRGDKDAHTAAQYFGLLK